MIRPVSIQIPEQYLVAYNPSNPIEGLNLTLDIGAGMIMSDNTRNYAISHKQEFLRLLKTYFISGYLQKSSKHTDKRLLSLLEDSLPEIILKAQTELAQEGVSGEKELETLVRLSHDGKEYLNFASKLGMLTSHDLFFQALHATYNLYPFSGMKKDEVLIRSLAALTRGVKEKLSEYGVSEGLFFDLPQPAKTQYLASLSFPEEKVFVAKGYAG